MNRPAEIGATIVIKGEITAREDLVISGRVEGSVSVPGHGVTVRAGAEVIADVEGRSVTVSGRILGDVTASDRVVLHGGSDLEGTLTAQHLRMEDGALFAGKVETTTKPKAGLQLAS